MQASHWLLEILQLSLWSVHCMIKWLSRSLMMTVREFNQVTIINSSARPTTYISNTCLSFYALDICVENHSCFNSSYTDVVHTGQSCIYDIIVILLLTFLMIQMSFLLQVLWWVWRGPSTRSQRMCLWLKCVLLCTVL